MGDWWRMVVVWWVWWRSSCFAGFSGGFRAVLRRRGLIQWQGWVGIEAALLLGCSPPVIIWQSSGGRAAAARAEARWRRNGW